MTVQTSELRHWILGLVGFVVIVGAALAVMLAARPVIGLQDAAWLLTTAVVLVEFRRRSRTRRTQP
jgi:uncharacterized membrane protein